MCDATKKSDAKYVHFAQQIGRFGIHFTLQAGGSGTQSRNQASGSGTQYRNQASGSVTQFTGQAGTSGTQSMNQASGSGTQSMNQASGSGTQSINQAGGSGTQSRNQASGSGTQSINQAGGSGMQQQTSTISRSTVGLKVAPNVAGLSRCNVPAAPGSNYKSKSIKQATPSIVNNSANTKLIPPIGSKQSDNAAVSAQACCFRTIFSWFFTVGCKILNFSPKLSSCRSKFSPKHERCFQRCNDWKKLIKKESCDCQTDEHI